MDWIGFLLRLRETRMPIGQMQAFAKLRGEGNTTAPERRQMLETHLAEVLAAIEVRQRSVRTLQDKITHYRAIEASLQTAPLPPERKPRAKSPSHLGPLPPRARQTARD
jgi:DNA-binding transcriptional MerR regulator